MAKAKKFGTFSGVFTPSILTILGVIMYLRFPSIIGQAGLINTIGIIVIAHIISITTSLSVASLSTDKPVKNGGTYFMISRSLGLPIGGTLGLALFIGLSFSVSLYLIGFAESFLQYWGFTNNIQNIRIAGTIVLIAVTTITFISTSLAIKSQYFIMVAIGLSLLSIFFGKHEFTPTEINLAPIATAAPFMVLFGIFFPAVTGFEAGVSMSGDLKNPKKSLPVGAMSAVGVGFIVYIGLAFFYAFTVDSSALVNDPQILFKISLVPALVIAGIWGATLSSALGSILGAPRILQAIAMDKIAPKFLAKGTGKTNEPRNALLLAFVIAEAGILIGELDVIARIVSMFFITTYAFLNLASAIESWSSSDFRPAFKVPRFVSILGTLSAFFVMILLDFLALAGATIVLGLLYFYLQRKELILESGDAWSSFWTNLAKRALLKLSIQKASNRNWRPNIILFSGGEKARPHLVEMGLALTGKLGALTDFKLAIGEKTKGTTTSVINGKEGKNRNHFIRELPCDTISAGIKSVTNVYGFSGFEPNTMLMGWSRNVQNADFLVSVLKDLKSKNLNAVFLDYDKNNGFGKKERIDIWWNGKGRHLSFSINLLRFLLSDASWRDAEIRIMIINSTTSLNDAIYRNTNAILAEKRIKAEVRVLSDDFGSRTKEEIINSESVNADLILLGLSQKSSAFTNEYINGINRISSLPSSLLILSPSTEFEEINLVEHLGSKITKVVIPKSIDLKAFPQITNNVVKRKLELLDEDLLKIGKNFNDKAIGSSTDYLQALLKSYREFLNHNRNALERELKEHGNHEVQKTILRNHQAFLRHVTATIEKSGKELIKETQGALNQGISETLTRLGNFIYEAEDTIHIPYVQAPKNKEKTYRYPYQKAIQFYVNQQLRPTLIHLLEQFEELSSNQLNELRNTILGINDAYEKLTISNEQDNNKILADITDYINSFKGIEEKLNQFKLGAETGLLDNLRTMVITLAECLETPANLKQSKRKIKIGKDSTTDVLSEFSENWATGMLLLNNTLYLDSFVLSRKNIFKNVIQKGNLRIVNQLTDTIIQAIDQLKSNMETIANQSDSVLKTVVLRDDLNMVNIFNETFHKSAELLEDFMEVLDIPESIFVNSEPLKFSEYSKVSVYPKKIASYFVDVVFHEPFYREVESLDHSIKTALVESKEANSMLLFHLNNLKESSADADDETIFDPSLFKKLALHIQEQKTKLETAIDRIKHYSMVYMHEAFSNLFYHSILEAEHSIHTEKRDHKGRKLSLVISRQIESFRIGFSNGVINLVNSASKGVILSKKYLAEKPVSRPQIQQILDLVEELLPDRRIYQSVPVFYRSLMSSSSRINDEFWVARNTGMEAIKEALKRHNSGLGGAIVIKGVHGAGKTALSRYAANHLFKNHSIFWINPPQGGSAHIDDLLAELSRQTSGLGDFNSIFNSMPLESTVVLNDLELWWERRPGGGEVIRKIIELIRTYGHKVFFILNCNSYSFKLLSQLFSIEDNSLAIIDCEPFSAKELQQLILSRHKSSGLSLTYHGKPEESISHLAYTILFNTYFNVSEGNPGIAMNIWKANIVEANPETISIVKPQKLGFEVLYSLQHDWLIVTALFIHHKNIGIEKLSRLTGFEVQTAESILVNLKNAGLIVQNTNGVFMLGRNIEPLLVEVCRSKGLI